jgi:hypothetical protein
MDLITAMGTTEINQTTTFVADKVDENYVVNVSLATTDLAIDASGAIKERTFTINGTLKSDNGPGILLGDKSLADIGGLIKIGDAGTFTSGGKGIVASSGGVNFENAGTFTASSTGIELRGDNNVFKNVGFDTGPGKLSSTKGSVLVTAGKNDNIENTGSAEITAQRDAIVSTGSHTTITNNGTAKITSIAGSAIVASGNHDTIYSVSQISAGKDVIISTGDHAKITNAGASTLSSNNGRGIVSKGDDATITNEATISTKLDGIFSSGGDAIITNSATITAWGGVAIRSAGANAIITNSTSLNGKTAGILSTGDHAAITNKDTINANGIGVSLAGDHSVLTSTQSITAGTAISISGNDATVTNENEITGTSKKGATIEVTASGHTTIVNHSAVSTQSGTVLSAGNGKETVINTGSLYGVVDLGGGNDVFKSLKGDVSGAVNGGSGNDHILNTGLLEYDVNLGSGNDVFSSLEGEVRGKVLGGSGDDLYIVGISLDIREAANGGSDTIQSKFTYTLPKNVENLELLGKGRMEATGNALDNRIEGNNGQNHLAGLGGKDIFVFEAGCRKDIIDDFADGKDRLDLSGDKGIDSFSDLNGKIAQSGADVVISLGSGDQVMIENAHKGEFSAADFIF